jgi:sucrose-6F-phosphate phosphohydrolase
MTFFSFNMRRLVVVDLDILTNSPGEGVAALQRALAPVRRSFHLVYVSGQSLSAQLAAIADRALILPDYIVSAVGTEIHRLPGETELEEWSQYVRNGFDRHAVSELLEREFPVLAGQQQSAEQQGMLKASWFLENANEALLHQIHTALLTAGHSARPVYSRNLYLDIIPERAGLGMAVKFLVDSLILAPNQVFVCGDSGNDIDLFQYGFRGIVVGNASHELKRAVELRAWFSHAYHAAGLLEGLQHYRFFDPDLAHERPGLAREGFDRAIESLYRNITPMGFSAASLTDNPLTDGDSNYFSVWSRDGIKTGLWTLCLRDKAVTECFRRTLLLMAEHQTPIGQIPANVRIRTNQPDYGGIGDIASIDSVLWFVIGCCRYAAHTGDRSFLEQVYPHIRKAMFWLHAHDSNNCGLIEIPESSDWMDLFPRSYNVLYDEALWYQACGDFHITAAAMGEAEIAATYGALTERIRVKILRQFWPTARKLTEVRESFSETQFSLGDATYLLAQISPFAFSWRCDVYANLLSALVGLLDQPKQEQLFHFLWGVGINTPCPVKVLYPVVQSGASDWKDYFITNFLNLPDHYHNGGIWPFVGGLWVRFLDQTGRHELAHQELIRLAEGCRQGIYGEWEFNEWLHGQTGRPMGKAHQAWSAAGYIAAYKQLHHKEQHGIDFGPLSVEMFEPSAEQQPAEGAA